MTNHSFPNMSLLKFKLMSGIFFSIISFSSTAALLDNLGTPDTKPAVLKTYGVDVAARVGLKAILPPGWTLLLHKEVTLPDTVTWKLGDPWVKAIAEIAVINNIAILIDWDKRQVRFREENIALDEREQRAAITTAAVTPLPDFGTATKSKFDLNTKPSADGKSATLFNRDQEQRAKGLQALANRSSEQLDRVPVIRTNPTERMVDRSNQNKATGRAPASDDTFEYSTAVSFNKPSARSIAQTIAHRYNLRLVWQTREFQLLGPVTLVATSPEEDLYLLQKAMGIGSPIALTISGKNIIAVPATSKTRDNLTFLPPERFSTLNRDAIPEDRELPKRSPLVTHSRAESVTFNIHKGDSLEETLISFLRTHGYTLEWKVDGIFEAGTTKTYEGASITSLLSQLLPSLGLSADVFTRDNHIVVRLAGSPRA